MQVFHTDNYIKELTQHYEHHFGIKGKDVTLKDGPVEKLHSAFRVFEFPPNKEHNFYCYCTVGMSVDRVDDSLVELVVYSLGPERSLIVLLTVCASYHRNGLPLNLGHTVNVGQPWLYNSLCDHGFISLPYLDGPKLEQFHFGAQKIHCYWFIPITIQERDYKMKHGAEALEQLFEEKQLDYLNPNRKNLVE